MALSRSYRIATVSVYILLLVAIVWEAVALLDSFKPGGNLVTESSYTINVTGDIRRPGTYRVPSGTTRFEILKVAGVRPTSDLSAFDLMSAVGTNDNLTVGSRQKQVDLKGQVSTARLEFFFGTVTLSSKDGHSLPTQQGISLSEGDRIQTQSASQAELSIGSFSRVDLDNFSDLSFDKMRSQDGNRLVTELFQKEGGCWFNINPAGKEELYRILTPGAVITVGGSGADFFVSLQGNQTVVDLMDGLLLVEKITGSKSMNLVAGQSATIYNDDRPFQVSRLGPDMRVSERFSQLTQEKQSSLSKRMPFNFLFCSTPSLYFIVSIQYDLNRLTTIMVPPDLIVDQFAPDISTLSQAYLYGGPTFVNSILDRITNIRLSKYAVFSRSNLLKTADIVGGITSTLSAADANRMKRSEGTHRLTSKDLSAFLSPHGASPELIRERQRQVIGNLLDDVQDKNIVLTPVSTQQILSLSESNFSVGEVMDNFVRFTSSGGNWNRREVTLPVKKVMINGRPTYEPDLERCRKLLEIEG